MSTCRHSWVLTAALGYVLKVCCHCGRTVQVTVLIPANPETRH